MDIRRATDDDIPAILALGRRSLGWLGDDEDARFFAWKHRDNPFGPSPMWVAEEGGRVAGFRTFLRWELRTPGGDVRRVVRAVDTATDPDFRGRGVFTELTLHALDELRAEGVDFVFNTPNDQSRPGYLKMGWVTVGRLPVAVRPTRFGSIGALARARRPAAMGAVAVNVGEAASAALADHDAVAGLLAGLPAAPGLATPRTPGYLAWRYGLGHLHYRAVTGPGGLGDGVAVFRIRRRGPALEAVVDEVLVPGAERGTARALLGRIAAQTGADHLVRIAPPTPGTVREGFLPVPGAGPVLTARTLGTPAPTALAAWSLTMGDVELF